MIKLNDDLLQELGLNALPLEEKKKMLAHIYETLEMRVGMKLAQQMTDEQLDEFEQFIKNNDEAGALHWLETKFPHYKDVVSAEFENLKVEIRQLAPQILASASANSGQMGPAAPQPQMPAQVQQPYGPQQQGPPSWQQQAAPPAPAPQQWQNAPQQPQMPQPQSGYAAYNPQQQMSPQQQYGAPQPMPGQSQPQSMPQMPQPQVPPQTSGPQPYQQPGPAAPMPWTPPQDPQQQQQPPTAA